MSLLMDVLLKQGLLQPLDAEQAEQKAVASKQPLINVLIDDYQLAAHDIAMACSRGLGYDYVIIRSETVDQSVITVQNSSAQPLLPLLNHRVAISDPELLTLLAQWQFVYQQAFTPCFTEHSTLIERLHRLTHGEDDLALLASEKVDRIITDAIYQRASDIHFEPLAYQYRIRLRVDGVLQQATLLDQKEADAVTSRIKILAKLDIAEKRLPQDGQFSFTTPKKLIRDCRVSTCPTLYGEKCVIRLLERNKRLLNVEELGMSAAVKALFKVAIARPQGLILVTGPTGSGKTVTLYTALDQLNKDDCNISTIEDPVEIKLHGVNQVNVNPKAGLTFATALRSFLRQDPDVIMVGEIRDSETAEIAIKAAQTGHLVFATLHTNSAVAAVERLTNLGVDQQLIESNLLLVIAQRLLRKCCSHCEGKGCDQCYSGYFGRTGVYEAFSPAGNIHTTALRDEALLKARLGVTTRKEVIRVT